MLFRSIGTPDEFLNKSAREHDARVHNEYKLLIEVARSRIAAARDITTCVDYNESVADNTYTIK